VHGVIVGWAARREPFRELDNTAPGHAMCLILERTGDERIVEATTELAEFLARRRLVEGAFVSFERAPLRRPYGGAALSSEHDELLANPGAGVFVDCLHFDPPFFAHLGALTNDHALVDLAAEQALAHLRLLQDESGLVWHFWLEQTRSRYGHAWARGQGWALLGLVDLLAYLPKSHAAYGGLQTALVRLADALAACQEPDGGWPAVAVDPGSGPETSTAAFVAAGFSEALRRGLLDARFGRHAETAWRHAWLHVGEGGKLAGVSAAVWASTEPSHYANVPTGHVVPWGQGPLLLAAERLLT
jgi:unsaturated rhamnogalacturonyl hydrolase